MTKYKRGADLFDQMWESGNKNKKDKLGDALVLKKLELADLANENALLSSKFRGAEAAPVFEKRDIYSDIQHLNLDIDKRQKQISSARSAIDQAKSVNQGLTQDINRLKSLQDQLNDNLISSKSTIKSLSKSSKKQAAK